MNETFPSWQVVQRQSRVITNDVLLTRDADTQPRDLIYEIIQPPGHGKLILTAEDECVAFCFSSCAVSKVSYVLTCCCCCCCCCCWCRWDSSGRAGASSVAQRFSQEDVDRRRLAFVHDGVAMEPTSFYFRVSDGRHKPVSGVFSVAVVRLTLRLANHTTVPMLQGHTTGVVTNASIGAETNGEPLLVEHFRARWRATRRHSHMQYVLHIRYPLNIQCSLNIQQVLNIH